MSNSRMTRVFVAALAVTMLAAGFVVTLAPTSFAQATVNVVINNYSFNPANITVIIGVNNTVTWTNQQTGVPHTVTSDDGSWSSSTLSTGQSFTHTFTTPGTFGYHCNIHTYMKGTVTVVGSGQASTTTTIAATTTPAAASTTTTAVPPTTSPTSSTSSGNGIPEFPYSGAALTIVSILVAASYLITRRSAKSEDPSAALRCQPSGLTERNAA